MDNKGKDWPLAIHYSFWDNWTFIKWQAQRRNERYGKDVAEIYKEKPNSFEGSAISHLLDDYTLSTDWKNYNPIFCSQTEGNVRYSTWRAWAIDESARRKSDASLEAEIRARVLGKKFTMEGFDCWPVSPNIC